MSNNTNKPIYPLTSIGAPNGMFRAVKDPLEATKLLIEEQLGIDDDGNLFSFIHGEWVSENLKLKQQED